MPDGDKTLVLVAAWVATDDPTEATDAVADALAGVVIPNSGCAVAHTPESVADPSFRRDLGRFDLAEALDA